jgi:hypothetical protein
MDGLSDEVRLWRWRERERERAQESKANVVAACLTPHSSLNHVPQPYQHLWLFHQILRNPNQFSLFTTEITSFASHRIKCFAAEYHEEPNQLRGRCPMPMFKSVEFTELPARSSGLAGRIFPHPPSVLSRDRRQVPS